MKFSRKILLIIIPAAIILNSAALTAGTIQQKDEQWRFLEVRRRQLELQGARKQYERTEKLAAQGLVPQTDVERDRSAIATAQLNYQQSVLALLDLQPRISVRSALKMQTPDGRRFVRLVLVNLTPTFDDSQFKLLNNFEGADPIPEQLRTRSVNDIFVSLRDSGASSGGEPNRSPRGDNATISLPFEIHIPQMQYDQNKVLDFQLLRDTDSVVVALTYHNQTQEVVVQLQRAAGESDVQISSSQFSQEADLGNQAIFNLLLERPTVDVRSFQLKVINLPRQVSYSFIDLESQARLSQINFPAGVTRQALGLRLFLPERADEQVQLDKSLEFWALVLEEASAKRFADERVYTDSEMAVAGSAKVRLVVIPRGIGRIEVLSTSLFGEIESGRSLETKLTLRNTGTRRLDNVKVSTEHPLNWRVEVEPDIVPSLEINREATIAMKIFPATDVQIGDYEVRIKTESFVDSRRVQSEDKIYRVSVKSKMNLFGTGALIGGLLLVLAGIVVFSMKMARR